MMDRNVVDYKEDHYPEIASWFVKRGMKPPKTWALSDTGYIIHGVAAGFLYLTNSGIGRIDLLISNPESSRQDRSNGIDSIIRKMITHAHIKYNMKLICCESSIRSIQRKARLFKFVDTGTFLGFAKEL